MVFSARRFGLNRLPQTIVLSSLLLAIGGCGGDDAAKSDATGDSGSSANAADAADPSKMMAAGAADGAAPAGAAGAGMMVPPGGAMTAAPGAMSPAGAGGMPPGAAGMNMAGGAAMMAPGLGYSEGGIPSGGAPAGPPRPANYVAWTDLDFENAVRERDPKVLEAIDGRVKGAPGDPKVAELLASLLVVSAEAPKVNANGPEGAAGYPNTSAPGAESFPPGGANPGATMQLPPGGAGIPQSSAAPGTGTQGRTPIQGVPQGAPQSAPQGAPQSATQGRQSIAPQSSLRFRPGNSLAVDSLSLMLAEAATAFQANPGVGALAGRLQGGGAVNASQPPGAGGLSRGAIPGGIPNPEGAGAASQTPGTGGLSRGAIPGGIPNAGGAGAASQPPGTGGMSRGSIPPAGTQAGGNPGIGPGLGAEMTSGGYPGGPGGGGGAGSSGLGDRQLVEHIVDGLIRNKSPKALFTVRDIAAGSVPTPLDIPTSAEIVVRGLFRNLAENPVEIEQLILALIDGNGQLSAESRSACMKAITEISAGASDMVTGLKPVAASSDQSGTGAPGSEMMGAGLGGRSSGPGMSMPGGPGGAEAGAGMMMPGNAPGGGAADASGQLPDDVLLSAASVLWSPRNVEIFAKQLEASVDPVSGAEILLLAATIPNKRMREAEFATFTRLFDTGADALTGTGIFGNGAHDPGLLVVLKSLPRQKPPRVKEGEAAPPMDSWTLANEELVLSLRDRLRALSAQPGKLTPTGDTFPVRFHRSAEAEFAGMITLPGAEGDGLKESAPSETRVYYARIPFSPRREKDQEEVAAHYESRASGFRRLDETRGVLWIDGVKGSPSAKRSMDVIIQSASSGGQGFAPGTGDAGGPGRGAPGFSGPGLSGPGVGGGSGGPFTIEIIVVETSDPTSSSEGPEQASSTP